MTIAEKATIGQQAAAIQANVTLADAAALLIEEAHHIDHQAWGAWMDLFTPDAWFWLPCWIDTENVTQDPDRELSLIYCERRAGLEERIARIKSGRSIASQPINRTLHSLSNIRAGDLDGTGGARFLANAVIHNYSPRTRRSTTFFGHYQHTLAVVDGHLRITGKKVIILNDYLPSALDVYMV